MISSFVVFQTLDSDFALAKNHNSQMVIAIRSSKTFNPLFDGKVIRGPFVMADTYSYETVKDDHGRSSYKTVPLMIPAAEYKQMQRELGNETIHLASDYVSTHAGFFLMSLQP